MEGGATSSRRSSSIYEENRTRMPYGNNYGSFFGPSQPSLAPRLLEKTSQLLEEAKKTAAAKTGVSGTLERVNEVLARRAKIEKLAASRDYSFLSSDDSQVLPHDSTKNLSLNTHSPSRIKTVEKKLVGASSTNAKLQPRKNPNPSPSLQNKFEKKNPSTPKPPLVKREEVGKSRNMRPRQISGHEDAYENEDERAFRMLRKLTRYDPRKYANEKDDVMETNFGGIEKEERRSAKLARKDDAEEIRKIEAEERKERLMRKKPKLMNGDKRL
ncbi:hypothetical protein RJ639_005450 [Escallonia herrerae]|uniref:Uncharacterized protein n=1 Tax=Escallonia herrerae TaxID=1293975 RepID=A0AA88VYB1_9ASTE|nr:hypothetical protein RJ639_005450 [Escallonia herrerae]